MQSLHDFFDAALGLSEQPHDLSLLQVSVRGVVVFVWALLLLRIAHKRFFARRNALDVLLMLVLASTLSRAINGSGPFVPSLGVGFLLVAVHRGLSVLAVRVHGIGRWVKGHSYVLVENGEIREQVMRSHALSREDIDEDLRLKGIEHPRQLRRAMLERNGEISILKQP